MDRGVRRSGNRTDAARNAERIVVAAWQSLAEHGADVQLDEIARRAGVGPATLYRHFANKVDLARAVLRWRYSMDLEPVIERALLDPDRWRGMTTAWAAALAMASRERHTIAVTRSSAPVAGDLEIRFLDALVEIVCRAQAEGLVRADVTRDDLLMLTVMLLGVVAWTDPSSNDWHRYLTLLLDALRPGAATPLPSVAPSGGHRQPSD